MGSLFNVFDDMHDSLMPLMSGDFGFFGVEYHDNDEEDQALKETGRKGEGNEEEVVQASSDEDLHRTRILIEMLQGAIDARETKLREEMAQGRIRTVTFKGSGVPPLPQQHGQPIGRLALEPYPDQLLAREGLEAFDLHMHRRIDMTDLLPDLLEMGAPDNNHERDQNVSEEYAYYSEYYSEQQAKPDLNPKPNPPAYYYEDYPSSAGEGALETRSPAGPQQPKTQVQQSQQVREATRRGLMAPPTLQVQQAQPKMQVHPPKTQVRSVESVEAQNDVIDSYSYSYEYIEPTSSEGSEARGPPRAGNSSRAAVPYATAASSAASADKSPATRASAHALYDGKAPATTLRSTSQVRSVTPSPQIESAERAPQNNSVSDASSDDEKVEYVQYGYTTTSNDEEIEAYVYEYEYSDRQDSDRRALSDRLLNIEQTLHDMVTTGSAAPPPLSSQLQAAPQRPPADFAPSTSAPPPSSQLQAADSPRIPATGRSLLPAASVSPPSPAASSESYYYSDEEGSDTYGSYHKLE